MLFQAKRLQSVSCGHDLLQAKPGSPCFPCNKWRRKIERRRGAGSLRGLFPMTAMRGRTRWFLRRC